MKDKGLSQEDEELHREEVLSEAALEDGAFPDTKEKPCCDVVPEEPVEDREDLFEDAEQPPDDNHDGAATAVFIAALVSGDLQRVKDEETEWESSIASEESYDSANERMDTDCLPAGSLEAQKAALKQLRRWHVGESSSDRSLLDLLNEDEFTSHVVNVANGKNLIAHDDDDDVIRNAVGSLLPMVYERSVSSDDPTRENCVPQDFLSASDVHGNTSEVELSEGEPNVLIPNGCAEEHDGYDGDVEEDLEVQSNRMDSQPNGMDLKFVRCFPSRGAGETDEYSHPFTSEGAAHDNSSEDNFFDDSQESETKSNAEADLSRNLETERGSVKNVRLEDGQAERNNSDAEKLESGADSYIREHAEGVEALSVSPPEILDQESERHAECADDSNSVGASELGFELNGKEAAVALSEGVSQNNRLTGEPDRLPASKGIEKSTGLTQSEGEGVSGDGGSDETFDILASLLSESSASRGTNTCSLGGAGPSRPEQPAGLERKVPSVEPSSRAKNHSHGYGASPSGRFVSGNDTEPNSKANDCNEETREKLQTIRVKLLRLAHRLGQTAHNVVVSQVLYRLGLAEQLWGMRSSSRVGAVSLERAGAIAEEQEATFKDDLDFTCTIMLLGKTGVGKSATINSIFDEVKSGTDAFCPATKRVEEITGTLNGIKLRVIDTPGLLPSSGDQRHNKKIMSSVKQFVKNSPPDIVIYVDRLDMPSTDYADLPLLRTITDAFGSAIWFNAVVVLTHASAARPDGANGYSISYEMFVAHRSHVVQRIVRQAAGDTRLVSPVSLVENHPACRTNRAGQRLLPNGQLWKPQLLLVCFASKILAEANSLLKLQDGNPSIPLGVRPRMPSLAFLLSSLLQSRNQLKVPDQLMGDEDESEEEFEEGSDSEDDEDYNELPPFRPLSRDELSMLDKDQRKAYFEEVDYRTKLLQKKQWREWLAFRREMREKKETFVTDEHEEVLDGKSSARPVPIPDMALPPSFDSDNSSYRYRHIESASQWLVKPVLENHGWDHDNGFEGLNLENTFVIRQKVPISFSGQLKKDKKEANIQMECAASLKHGEGKVTLVGLDVQTIGKNLAYTLHSDTRFSNFRRNKTTGSLAATFFGNTVSAGMKLEDSLQVGRRLKLVLNGSAMTREGDVAYGGSLEAALRDKHYPLDRALSTIGLFVINWHEDWTCGGNFHSQFVLGKTTIIAKASVNNKGAGQLRIRASSSEQLQMVLIGIIPLLRALVSNQLLSSS